MSSSRGDVITPSRLLEIYEPALLKWLYLRFSPQKKFDIALGGDQIIGQYVAYDRAISDLIDKSDSSDFPVALLQDIDTGDANIRHPLPFRKAIEVGQLVGWDLEKSSIILEKLGLYGLGKDSVRNRLAKGKAALETYDQDSVIELRETKNHPYFDQLPPTEKEQIRKLVIALRNIDFDKSSISDLEKILYGIPKEDLDPEISRLAELDYKDPGNATIAGKIRGARKEASPLQRSFFKNIYNLVLDKDTGPRLPTFVWVMKDKFMDLLDFGMNKQ